MKNKSIKERIRRWLDEDDSDPLEDIFKNDTNKRKAEMFINKIVREVALVFDNKILSEPDGKVHLPFYFLVFLSPPDDKRWTGVEQDILKKILKMTVYIVAKDIAGDAPLASQDYEIEFRIDGTLEEGKVRVVGSFEPFKQDTFYSADEAEKIAASAENRNPTVKALTQPETPAEPVEKNNQADDKSLEPEETEYFADDSEKTEFYDWVKPFDVEVWQDNKFLTKYTFYKKSISIGRNSQTGSVDIPLSDNTYVSRLHARLEVDERRNYWVRAESKNPTFVEGKKCPTSRKVRIKSGESVQIMNFNLRFPELIKKNKTGSKSLSTAASNKRRPVKNK